MSTPSLTTDTLEQRIREAQGDSAQPWEFDNVATLQSAIDNGYVWHLEGSAGRAAMAALESGACFLPDKPARDYYGNRIPARSDLKPGTKGTLENSARFYGLS